MSLLASLARGILWAGGDPRMTGCLESPLARPILAQSWSQTATDGACFSTTALLSGRDRDGICVLRPRGSEPKTRRTGVWRPLPQASASSWRALVSGARPLSVPIDAGCIIAPDPESAPSAYPTSCMARGPSVEHLPSRKKFILIAKSWPYGAHGYSTPSASNCT